MGARNVQQSILFNDMFEYLNELGAEPIMISDNEIHCKTICHGGSSHKLYYYENTKAFTCYTDSCGSRFSIYDLVMMVRGMEFPQAFKVVCDRFGISGEFDKEYQEAHGDTSFLKIYDDYDPLDYKELQEYDENILNLYPEIYHKSWINDGISAKTMAKFGIRLNIGRDQIVIPHYHVDGRLVGIRVRNLDPKIAKNYKYMPLFQGKENFAHPTSKSIYGLYENKEIINKYKMVAIFEGEKSVMQMDGFENFPSIGGAISGNSLSDEQISLLLDLDINEVLVGMDKEYKKFGTNKEKFYQQKMRSEFIDQLSPYFSISMLWDKKGLLEHKDSPTDKGEDVFMKMYNERWRIN